MSHSFRRRCIGPLANTRDSHGKRVYPWVDRVRYLYTPQEFARDKFYHYDLVYYSGVLFEWSGCTIPCWFPQARGVGTFGAAPVGLLKQHTNVTLVPAQPMKAGRAAAWLRVGDMLPRLPPLRVPAASEAADPDTDHPTAGLEWRSFIDSIDTTGGAISEGDETESDTNPEDHVRLVLRLGTSTPWSRVVAGDESWSRTAVEQLEQALLPKFRIAQKFDFPLLGSREGLWIWELASRPR